MRQAFFSLTGLVAAVALLASPSSAAPATHEVVVAGMPGPFLWTWDPADLTVVAGDRVVWKNPSAVDHHVAPYAGEWDGELHLESGGGTAKFRFKIPGTYLYRCDIQGHSEVVAGRCIGQCGSVTVE